MGSGSSKALRRELSDLEQKRTRLAGEIERAEAKVATAEEKLADVVELETSAYVGEADPGDAARAREKAEAAIAQVRSELQRLQGIGAGLDERIRQTHDAIAAAEKDEAVSERDAKASNSAKLSKAFADALAPLLALVPKLEAARSELDAATVRARSLDPTLALPSDEATWGETDALAALARLVEAGPRQPNATNALSIQRAAAQHLIDRAKAIESAVREELHSLIPTRQLIGGQRILGPIERLPEGQRADAIRAFAAAVKRAPDRARPSLEQRLKELRETPEGLAENAEAGGGAELDRGPLAPAA
ncbi:MAG: hypothetical protein ABSC36_04995 [Gaiellaceae bacterium]|jgi:hypothetical protein